ncbi:MAG: hypothetical protein A2504_06320 [Bdellovibrionales bacterium RIFOXYD12_FULL_39_22]|nr:MAG: hypothetical protein A2385_08640 [Bdellovibrionales bacterium RIFOXYB1_FULL_39_21]OFZ45228.1 MAG: hypothetical protein A2485_05890 [Bdellovibrionales bacterium RIFOXYC12_FULL_39_17]OFZ45580.1 MAG: hypothetical protein A2404_03220 [Bdellovibrionales bacterium RIFOXYC1_FULL_39_130]OFZ71384.1 MAG: hypothetical protein A2451_00460 [Bdellovibrionales bacterium RIFOXYC2_FULL_39_8]OFZ77442.1 MAG: hypothetical protein A2560_08810 [Bdellovibrionales bacterium RIFOXYD1_FULL_39_84]OFZ91571.1 MAG:
MENNEFFNATNTSSIKTTMPINFPADEIDLDDISFMPMTDGLGFHNDPHKNFSKAQLKSSKSVKSSAAISRGNIPQVPIATFDPQIQQNSLRNFYDFNQKDTVGEKQRERDHARIVHAQSITSAKARETKLANMKIKYINQPLAWIVDVLIIALAVVTTFFFFWLAADIQLSALGKIIAAQEILIFSVAMFVLYYLIYFSILELSATPGKALLKIRLAKTDTQDLAIKNSATRAVITLLSFLVGGLPLFMDFQGKLSDTCVEKKLPENSEDNGKNV